MLADVCVRIFKKLSPILLLFTLAIYARLNFVDLSSSLKIAVQYLPNLLAILTIGLGLHFNQGRITAYTLLIVIIFIIQDLVWFDSSIKIALLATIIPLLLLMFTILRDKGVVSFRAISSLMLFVLALAFFYWVIRHQPEGLINILLMNWFPVRYFDWSQMPQTAIVLSVLILFSLVFLFARRQDSISATALGVFFCILVLLNSQNNIPDRIVFSSVGLLMCLMTIVQESWRMAYLDELTDLPGRRALREKLQSMVGIYAIAMVDVDHFKKFNDNYGHDVGDEVLRMIAAKLKNVGGGGTAYRYGGEEFTLVFPGRASEDVMPHLEAVRETIAKTPFVVNRRVSTQNSKKLKNKTTTVTISLGLADSIGKKSANETMKLADKALFKAKKKGRNKVSL